MPPILVTVAEALPYLLAGGLVTLAIVVLALLVGLLVGLPFACILVYTRGLPRFLIRGYVWFFRGTPILVLLFLFYFGIPQLLGIDVSAFAASVLVLGLASGAYQTQIFRGAILAVPGGQYRAALALGLTPAAAIRIVVLPQAIRLAIPAWSNEYSILLKDSAVVFILGTPEIMARTHFIASRTYEHLAFYSLAGLLYFCITLAGLFLLRRLEKRLRLPGYSGVSS